MKRKLLALILALLMALCIVPAAVLADGGEIDATAINLIKITTEADFNAGEMNGLALTAVGNGAVALADGATEGTFTSAVYKIADFYKMTSSWNAAIYDGTHIEIYARAYTNDAWDEWFSWGKYGMSILRGCNDDNSIDEYIPGGTITKAQFRAVLRRDSADLQSPVLRQFCFSVKGGDVVTAYAETPVATLPASKMNASPAYSQMIRDPEIGGSICSPSTISVMLNARDPELDILPEELALSIQDFNYGFGNWAYCVSAAGLYGYNSYLQYGDINIVLQELANGRSVGLSVTYSPDPESSYPYLPGAYGGTGGHLITIIGYEFEGGDTSDLDSLYLISSDTYSGSDATSFHRYQWKYFDACWQSRTVYVISSEPEAGAPVTGVKRLDATLEATSDENVYTLKSNGSKVDLTNFTSGKRATLGHGVLAYTIEGIKTTESVASDSSIVYENRIQVSANNTFFYTGIKNDDDGNLAFDAGDALYKAGVPEGESRTITVYAMANNGRRYTATITATSAKAQVVVEDYETVATSGNLVHVDLNEGTLSGGAKRKSGEITLASGETSGIYTTPVYSNEWAWEYLMATINAVTPGASSVELQVRAIAERAEGAWSDWFTWGKFGSGIASMSNAEKDDNLNLSTDILTVRGDSSIANVKDVQFRVKLRADEDGNVPTVFGINFTYKKSTYDPSEAVYTGSTSADKLPASASVDVTAASAYGHASGMASWRFENMMLMMVNSEGSDALFEEVALNGYDFNTDWGNWAYTVFKAGLFGHKAYTQYGANPTLIQQAIADGNIVGLYVHGGKLETTNSSSTSQVIVYAYETKDDGTVVFKTLCPRGDTSELESGAVFGTCTADELSTAISSYNNGNPRGAMYVVGKKVKNSSVVRVPVAAKMIDSNTIQLAEDGENITLSESFTSDKDSVSGCGVIAYTLASEVKAGKKLSANKFYYDITVNSDGTLNLPDELTEKIAAGDTVNLYVIRNSGVTYTANIVSADKLEKEKENALNLVNRYLASAGTDVYEQAKEIARKATAKIGFATSLKEIEDALELLDTKLEPVSTNTGSNATIPLPPQTGAAESVLPFVCIAAAVILLAVCRRRQSR